MNYPWYNCWCQTLRKGEQEQLMATFEFRNIFFFSLFFFSFFFFFLLLLTAGRTCDVQIDDCLGQVCEHNGTCIDAINDFQCACVEQYTGRKCGVYIDRCLATPCHNDAQCRDPGYGQALQCRCRAGWEGPLCDVDLDECLLVGW